MKYSGPGRSGSARDARGRRAVRRRPRARRRSAPPYMLSEGKRHDRRVHAVLRDEHADQRRRRPRASRSKSVTPRPARAASGSSTVGGSWHGIAGQDRAARRAPARPARCGSTAWVASSRTHDVERRVGEQRARRRRRRSRSTTPARSSRRVLRPRRGGARVPLELARLLAAARARLAAAAPRPRRGAPAARAAQRARPRRSSARASAGVAVGGERGVERARLERRRDPRRVAEADDGDAGGEQPLAEVDRPRRSRRRRPGRARRARRAGARSRPAMRVLPVPGGPWISADVARRQRRRHRRALGLVERGVEGRQGGASSVEGRRRGAGQDVAQAAPAAVVGRARAGARSRGRRDRRSTAESSASRWTRPPSDASRAARRRSSRRPARASAGPPVGAAPAAPSRPAARGVLGVAGVQHDRIAGAEAQVVETTMGTPVRLEPQHHPAARRGADVDQAEPGQRQPERGALGERPACARSVANRCRSPPARWAHKVGSVARASSTSAFILDDSVHHRAAARWSRRPDVELVRRRPASRRRRLGGRPRATAPAAGRDAEGVAAQDRAVSRSPRPIARTRRRTSMGAPGCSPSRAGRPAPTGRCCGRRPSTRGGRRSRTTRCRAALGDPWAAAVASGGVSPPAWASRKRTAGWRSAASRRTASSPSPASGRSDQRHRLSRAHSSRNGAKAGVREADPGQRGVELHAGDRGRGWTRPRRRSCSPPRPPIGRTQGSTTARRRWPLASAARAPSSRRLVAAPSVGITAAPSMPATACRRASRRRCSRDREVSVVPGVRRGRGRR